MIYFVLTSNDCFRDRLDFRALPDLLDLPDSPEYLDLKVCVPADCTFRVSDTHLVIAYYHSEPYKCV